MTTKKLTSWLENNFVITLIGSLIVAMIIGNVTLYSENAGIKKTVEANQKQIESIESQLIGKEAWKMMRDDVKDIKTVLTKFAEKNEADHDSVKAKLGRVNATLKAKR